MPDRSPVVHSVSSGAAQLTVEEHGEANADSSVLFLPALGVPLAYYRPLLGAWARRGRHTIGVETRGMPQSPVVDLRRDRFGYTHLVRTDLPAVFAAAPVDRCERVVLVGHSLGGQLALLATGSGAVRADAVVTIASGTSSAASLPLLRRVQRRSAVSVVRLVSATLGYWPGHRLGFGGRQSSGLMRDWAYEARTGRYRLHGDEIDYESALREIAVPVRLVALDGDTMVPAHAVDHLARRLGADQRSVTLHSGDDQPFDHFRWARRSPDLIIDDIEGWLNRSDL